MWHSTFYHFWKPKWRVVSNASMLYGINNLKGLAQQRQRKGPQTRVGDDSTPIPKGEWNSGFLKNEEHKKELFSFISTQISLNWHGWKAFTEYPPRDSTLQQTLWPYNTSAMQPFQGRHQDPPASENVTEDGHATAYVFKVDSDVLVLAV